uniref:Uncharacterized protein n=1 Tax=Rhizophora mucronata TaxID=61149 RepID=A0A2P2MCR3_RHIMU
MSLTVRLLKNYSHFDAQCY